MKDLRWFSSRFQDSQFAKSQISVRHRNSIFSVLVGLCGLITELTLRAGNPPQWDFNPRTVGAALIEGGWMVKRPISTISVSPEFSFPLQLVYLSNRSQRGLFGGQWFCPQLESRILPGSADLLVWTMPSGGVMGLKSDRKANRFADKTGEWQAKVSGVSTTVSNAEGWNYSYRAGRITTIQAPSGRQLEFVYAGQNLETLKFSDPATGTSRPLVSFKRWGNNRVLELEIGEGRQIFDYENGRDGKLSSWTHPGSAKPDTFTYQKQTKVLASIQPGILNSEALVFTTELTNPKSAPDPLPEEGKNPRHPSPRNPSIPLTKKILTTTHRRIPKPRLPMSRNTSSFPITNLPTLTIRAKSPFAIKLAAPNLWNSMRRAVCKPPSMRQASKPRPFSTAHPVKSTTAKSAPSKSAGRSWLIITTMSVPAI